MVTPSHRLIYGYAEVLKSISTFERRIINNYIWYAIFGLKCNDFEETSL